VLIINTGWDSPRLIPGTRSQLPRGLGPRQTALTETARLSQDDAPFAIIMKMLAAKIERELETKQQRLGIAQLTRINYSASGR
jgi:hypothetical protein